MRTTLTAPGGSWFNSPSSAGFHHLANQVCVHTAVEWERLLWGGNFVEGGADRTQTLLTDNKTPGFTSSENVNITQD